MLNNKIIHELTSNKPPIGVIGPKNDKEAPNMYCVLNK